MRVTYFGRVIAGSSLILFSLATQAQQGASEPADIVFFNGKVLTVDTDAGDFTVAEGLAIRNSIIVEVGSDEQVLRQAGSQTQRIDLWHCG